MKLIFWHLPKSGGTSVIEAIQKAQGNRSHGRIPFSDPQWTARRFMEYDPAWDFYSSHHAFAPNLFRPDREAGEFYFTWVRHPLSMLVSAWNYYRAPGQPSEFFMPPAVGSALLEVRRHRSIDSWLWSLTTGEHEPLFPRYYFRKLADYLDRFDFVGVCEEMGTSCRLLGERVDLRIEPEHVNASGSGFREDDYSPQLLAALRTEFTPEIALYYRLRNQLMEEAK